MRAAVDEAVSYNIDLGNGSQSAHFLITQRTQQKPHDLLTRRFLNLFFLNGSLRVLHHDVSGAVAKLDPALPQASRRMIRDGVSNFVKAGFLTARTGVEYQNFH